MRPSSSTTTSDRRVVGGLAPEDDDMEQAAAFPLSDALKLIGEPDSATQGDSLVGPLTGAIAQGTTWLYRNRSNGETPVARW